MLQLTGRLLEPVECVGCNVAEALRCCYGQGFSIRQPRLISRVGEAHSSIGGYLDFYNDKHPQQSLDGGTPDQAYFTELPFRAAA